MGAVPVPNPYICVTSSYHPHDLASIELGSTYLAQSKLQGLYVRPLRGI